MSGNPFDSNSQQETGSNNNNNNNSQSNGSTGGILQQHARVFEEQEAALDRLSDGVRVVRRLGENINQEANLHVSLLGEIDHDLERANSEMNNNLSYARRLHKRTGTCSLWIAILGLLVVLIFLLSFQ